MGDVIEESFEYRRDMLGPIDRCNVSCGSYGDKFHRWDDAGPYVEYEDHIKHISLYAEEIDAQRLRADTAEAEVSRLRETATLAAKVGAPNFHSMKRELAAAEQRIAGLKSVLERMLEDDDMPVHWFAQRIDAALNQKSEGGES